MSSNVTDPANGSTAITGDATMASPKGKGKNKAQATDEPMNEEAEHGEEEEGEEEEEEEDDEGDDDGEEEEEEETYEEIDPSLITGRRTRGVRVDYTSKEALDKAGLTQKELDDDDNDDVSMG